MEADLERVGNGAEEEAEGGEERSGDGDAPAAVAVGQRRGQRSGQQRDGHQQAADPRRVPPAALEVIHQLHVDDAEREGGPVGDQVHAQRRQHHHLSTTSVTTRSNLNQPQKEPE